MRHLIAGLVTSSFLWTGALAAGPGQAKPYDIADASYLPYTLSLEAAVKTLPKALKPPAGVAHRCVVLKVQMRVEKDVMTPLYFDRFWVALAGEQKQIPAVGVGLGPLPLKAGDPESEWKDQWEMGKAKGAFSLLGSGKGTSEVKLLFLVPESATEVTLMQKGEGGTGAVVKAGIRIPAEGR